MVKKTRMDTTERKEGRGQGMKTDPAEGQTGSPVGEEQAPEGQLKDGDLMQKVQEAEQKAAENYDKYVRALAELDNYKKRAVREKADAIRYGNETLLRDILPLVDNMDRALEHACNSDDFEAFKQGLRLLKEQFLGCLQKHGVATIETVGKDFDPHVHEAMLQVESEQHEESKVVCEFEKGYLLNGRLLRPAKVSVCRRAKSEDRQDCAGDN